jgi:hypothetical protein
MPGRWKSDREDEFLYLKVFLAVVTVVAAIAGLIEWNARRQAAAMTREFMRPATPEEQAQIQRQLAGMEAGWQREAARLQQSLRTRPAAQPARRDPRPLDGDERCIDGQRFKRLENGWSQNGTCA